MKSLFTAALALLLPILALAQQNTESQPNATPFQKKRNLFDENQKMTIEISYEPTFATTLTSLTNISYAYVRNQKHKVSFNTTLGDLAKHRSCYIRVYTDEYAAFRKGRSTKVPQAPKQIIAKKVEFVRKSEKNQSVLIFQNRVDFNLVFSENITEPDNEGLQVYRSPEYFFEPVVDYTQFWVLESMKSSFDLESVLANETLAAKSAEVTLQFMVISLKGFLLTVNMEQTFDVTPAMKIAGEQVKELLGENSIEYLLFTLFAHVLHGIFHILSLKNDIEYWNNVKDFEGVSLSNIWWEAFFHILQVLYFLDTKFEGPALWLVYMSTAVSIQRIFKVHLTKVTGFPFYKFKMPESYGAKTKGIESKVIKMQLYAFSGIIACYYAYRYMYNPPQEGLYTFTLKCMMYFSMAFSFVQMTPQVYINYVYKSVPKMPVRMLIYKFLDATVDDLITLALSLPPITLMMHFTDDLIFAILMIQRWMYKVDDRRTEKSHMDKPIEGDKPVPQPVQADPTPAEPSESDSSHHSGESDSSDEGTQQRKPKEKKAAKKKGKKQTTPVANKEAATDKPKAD